MKNPILITILTGSNVLLVGNELLINEDQICSIEPASDCVIIKMSNGDVHKTTHPTYIQWKNDYYAKND